MIAAALGSGCVERRSVEASAEAGDLLIVAAGEARFLLELGADGASVRLLSADPEDARAPLSSTAGGFEFLTAGPEPARLMILRARDLVGPSGAGLGPEERAALRIRAREDPACGCSTAASALPFRLIAGEVCALPAFAEELGPASDERPPTFLVLGSACVRGPGCARFALEPAPAAEQVAVARIPFAAALGDGTVLFSVEDRAGARAGLVFDPLTLDVRASPSLGELEVEAGVVDALGDWWLATEEGELVRIDERSRERMRFPAPKDVRLVALDGGGSDRAIDLVGVTLAGDVCRFEDERWTACAALGGPAPFAAVRALGDGRALVARRTGEVFRFEAGALDRLVLDDALHDAVDVAVDGSGQAFVGATRHVAAIDGRAVRPVVTLDAAFDLRHLVAYRDGVLAASSRGIVAQLGRASGACGETVLGPFEIEEVVVVGERVAVLGIDEGRLVAMALVPR